ncbi:MAG: DUF1788 domain-containing protein [Candidatus Aquicultor secundus]|uniref:DUF1788 domain-containing protein n=3 Tax=Candidatus Aquicultor secundus TaxID=1973895 RepID=A0A2M7TB75_9ACTN|nr:DUF1788 domain-containing protein [Solirubrobacter sp.]OIO87778.1 MAG: hypothetical protein AUK32_03035 [Candidatus Aquicultor secundus]PIU27308.1 MAG: DUF1788 domain-containing protein [Candidatus Aquicultor secundus]PIW21234.1 MAG: DUF1788 domain-containing protein [Candidatus Aquicultor secundus]PIX51596.1 MAG: DUF1788 domain-containing protein [Candidatus Aquicultor secundus]
MGKDMSTRPMQERFEHLQNVISSQRFLKKQGLGNEVPFFICPFDPKEAVEMEKTEKRLTNKLKQSGIQVLSINLYDLSITLLKERGIFERILETEETRTKDELKELLQSVLDPEAHLIPAIAGMIRESDYDVMFISGVGEVFPYIRSHNVLNNLQSTAKEKPTVMFFPGDYTHSLESGASLDLFGKLQDDKYYRAFNIYHYEV